MRILVFHLILIVFAIVSSGCTHSLDIRYNPRAIKTPNELSPEGTNIYLAPIEDIRSNKFSKGVNTGFNSFQLGYYSNYAPTESPVDLTKKALTEKLRKYGINIVGSKEKAHGVLKGVLKDFSVFLESALYNPDQSKAVISIDLELYNSKETDVLWSQNIYGNAPALRLPMAWNARRASEESLSEALVKAVNSLDRFPKFIKTVSSLFTDPNLNNRQPQPAIPKESTN